MIFFNIVLILFWLVLIPFVTGKTFAKKEEQSLIYFWTIGNVFQMAMFFIISMICILTKTSFFLLWKVYSLIIGAIFLIFLLEFHEKIFTKPKFSKASVYKIAVIILIGIQLFIKIRYSNVNDDDYSFVALSKQMIQTGQMYYSDEEPELIARRALAPISAYYATLAKQTGIDSTILTHSVMPLFLIIMAYGVYYIFAKKVLKNEENSYIALIFLNIINIYAINVKGISKYMLLYTWFGRAILGSITLPLIWYLSLDAMNKKSKFRDWFLLFCSVLASCLGSQMAVPLVSISLGGLALISSITDKKISYCVKTGFCLIPCIVVGMIYIIIG